MSKLDNYKKVQYNNKLYAVITINDIPVLLDWPDFKTVQKLDKTWNLDKNGVLYCYHIVDNKPTMFTIHELIMTIMVNEGIIKKQDKAIVHINRLSIDNRRENLQYNSKNKKYNKNMTKKARTIELPDDCGINPDDIPTYIWYIKADNSHGERFMVKIGNVTHKTTCSKFVSLSDKLEEAKSFLRKLQKDNPDLFKQHSMNGEPNDIGRKLLDSFCEIAKKGGFTNIKKFQYGATANLLTPK